jgi:hypothetical protein
MLEKGGHVMKIKDFFKNHAHLSVSIVAVLCAVQFISTLVFAIKRDTFDSNTSSQLLSTADGFEAVVLFFIMAALNKNDK